LEKLKILISEKELQNKVKELGTQISEDYRFSEIVLICNLKGAFIFLADLSRSIKIPLSVDFIATSSYDGTDTTEDVRIIKDLKMDVRDKDVLIVEDIVDTGYTLDYIIRYLKLHKPKSIRVCTLLDKGSKRQVDVKIDYIGFAVPDRFLVGYGLDYNEKYRELNYIAELILER